MSSNVGQFFSNEKQIELNLTVFKLQKLNFSLPEMSPALFKKEFEVCHSLFKSHDLPFIFHVLKNTILIITLLEVVFRAPEINFVDTTWLTVLHQTIPNLPHKTGDN